MYVVQAHQNLYILNLPALTVTECSYSKCGKIQNIQILVGLNNMLLRVPPGIDLYLKIPRIEIPVKL